MVADWNLGKFIPNLIFLILTIKCLLRIMWKE